MRSKPSGSQLIRPGGNSVEEEEVADSEGENFVGYQNGGEDVKYGIPDQEDDIPGPNGTLGADTSRR